MIKTGLIKFDEARAALAKVVTVDEAKAIRDKAEAARMYAKQVGYGLEMQNQCAEIKIRAERRAGELLREMEKSKGGRPGKTGNTMLPVSKPDTTPKLDDLGIAPMQSHRWQREAAIPEKKFEKHIEETKAQGAELTTASVLRLTEKAHVSHASGENEWYTPLDIIDLARRAMGGIDCDPASSELANRTVGAGTFFTAADDGLEKKWKGRVWLNPPYAQPLIARFAEAVTAKYRSKEIEQACILVNNATETAWCQGMLAAGSCTCLLSGRVKFLDVRGDATGAPLQGQIVIYMGSEIGAFKAAFGGRGVVLYNA